MRKGSITFVKITQKVEIKYVCVFTKIHMKKGYIYCNFGGNLRLTEVFFKVKFNIRKHPGKGV